MKKYFILMCSTYFLMSCGQEVNTAEEVDGVAPADHRIFITSSVHTGNLGSINAANTICDNLAKAAGLTRIYVAILSAGETRPATSLGFTGGVYIVDSNQTAHLVVASGVDLWLAEDKQLLNRINVNENGATVSETPWTGTVVEGAGGVDNCSDWLSDSSSVNGFHGSSDQFDDRWVENTTSACNVTHPLFCISQ
ncbi:MAG: DUF1554 domain-containing protein [Halobacteriovoraceae bacterium]|nr:DUF1554 domain-containing protein [Halobacteriovoraceae bacterium]